LFLCVYLFLSLSPSPQTGLVPRVACLVCASCFVTLYSSPLFSFLEFGIRVLWVSAETNQRRVAHGRMPRVPGERRREMEKREREREKHKINKQQQFNN
jgi:hypothetical protein